MCCVGIGTDDKQYRGAKVFNWGEGEQPRHEISYLLSVCKSELDVVFKFQVYYCQARELIWGCE